eukprot:m51a1_g12881 putative leucine rich repeat protein (561) ;mRNA; f:541-2722
MLTALPPEIGTLKRLTELIVSGNQLRALPPDIGTLINLTLFHVANNQLTALPPEIGRLANLTQLYVNDNQLTALPPEIGTLTKLTELIASGNPIADVQQQKFVEVDVLEPVHHLAGLLALLRGQAAVLCLNTNGSSIRGPLTVAAACLEAFERAAEASEQAAKRAAQCTAERQAAAEQHTRMREAAEVSRKCVAQLEAELAEQREALSAAEHSEREAAAAAAAADTAKREACRTAQQLQEEEQRTRKALDTAGKQAGRLRALLEERRIEALDVGDVVDVLHEVGLGSHAVEFQKNQIKGRSLVRISKDRARLRKLGITSLADCLHLRHALMTVEACGQLRLSRPALNTIATALRARNDNAGADAVVAPSWTPEDVSVWLERCGVAAEVREVLRRARVTGSQLMHLSDEDLEELGISAMKPRDELVQLAEKLRDDHFAAIGKYFGDPVAVPSALPRSPVTGGGAAGAEALYRALLAQPNKGEAGQAVPVSFQCPITLELMEDPVVAPDGCVYEAAAICRWLEDHDTSPMTGAAMARESLVRCRTLRSDIQAYRQRSGSSHS